MEGESNTASAESTQATTETQGADTQHVDSQSTEQEETTQESASVGQSMEIGEAAEPENSEESQVTIDDIVSEALSGEISEETQKLIEENGLGKHIDMLVAGHKAIQEKNNQEIFSVVGSEQSYQELQEWGVNNMSAEEKEAFNSALFSGNMNLAKLAVQGLKARYESVVGKSPDRIIEGGGSANTENRPYSDVHEYLKETQTLQYKQNPEYRAQVEARRNKSGF